MLHTAAHLQLVSQSHCSKSCKESCTDGVLLAVELSSTSRFAATADIFETIDRCSLRLQRATCLLHLAMDFIFNVKRQVARKIVSCNTSFFG